MVAKLNPKKQFLALKTEDNVPVGTLRKNMTKIYLFASLKPLKKGVGSGIGSGSGSISQRYGSGDPYPQQNVTDP